MLLFELKKITLTKIVTKVASMIKHLAIYQNLINNCFHESEFILRCRVPEYQIHQAFV
jgi:hypothetical protein